MNLQHIVRVALAFAIIASFGISLSGLDLAPGPDLPVLGISFNTLD